MVVGKTPGVRITQNSGVPGGGSVIRIRGGSSLNASNDPLIVIDGVPVDNGGIAGAANPLALINPEDIESFTVLKDASAAAIYGSRAANGVILITTKRAASGKFSIELSTNSSAKQIIRTIDVLDTAQLKDVIRRLGSNRQKTLINEPSANSSTDWQEEIYQMALINDVNLTLSGGSKALPYRVGLERYDEQGNLRTGKLERSGVNINLTPKLLNNHLKVDLNAKYYHIKNRFADGGAIGSAVVFDPTRPVRRDTSAYNGYFEWANAARPLDLSPRNPVGLLNQKDDRSGVNRALGNVLFDYEMPGLKDLHLFLNLGVTFRAAREPYSLIPPLLRPGYAKESTTNTACRSRISCWKLISTIKEIGGQQQHRFHGGYSFQRWNTFSPAFPDLNVKGDTIQQAAPNDFETENALMSFYGRMNVNIGEKFLVTATLRSDGSSRFSPETRWGLFPSVAAAWRISEMAPFVGSNTISNLKLRLGWGRTGQQDGIGDYGYVAAYTESTLPLSISLASRSSLCFGLRATTPI